jgi:hypothetical protein
MIVFSFVRELSLRGQPRMVSAGIVYLHIVLIVVLNGHVTRISVSRVTNRFNASKLD